MGQNSAPPRSLPVGIESLEARRLLAVNFEYNIFDPGRTYAAYYDQILNVMEAAGNDWTRHFAGTSTIEVEIQFENAPGVLAFANATHFETLFTDTVDGVDDVDIVETGVMAEIRSGAMPGNAVDPNGQDVDAVITFGAQNLDDFSYDVSSLRPLPRGKFDALSIATHELGHVLGFFDLSNTGSLFFNPETQRFQTTFFETLLEPSTGGKGGFFDAPFQFIGAAAQSVYGRPVPFNLESGPHYGTRNADDPLRNLLMYFAGDEGQIVEVSALDVAILADLLGPTVILDSFSVPREFGPVLKIEGTSANDVIEVVFTGSHYVVKRNFVTSTERYDAIEFDSVLIETLGGDDRIILSGTLPGVSVNGGEGNDTILGGSGSESLTGGSGADQIVGNSGDDLINGGSGKDRLFGGTGADRIFGKSGDDYLEGLNGNDTLEGGDGADLLMGGGGDDVLRGMQGSDTLNGGTGKDRLDGGARGDLFVGGGGRDTADYRDRIPNLILTLNGLRDDGEIGEEDNILSGIEVIIGGLGDDRIAGDGRANIIAGGEGRDSIDGGSGADTIEGNASADVIDGQAGNDLIFGGGGNDRLVGGSDVDEILGELGNDRLFSFDRFGDHIAGGEGTDFAEADESDTLSGTENDDLLAVAGYRPLRTQA